MGIAGASWNREWETQKQQPKLWQRYRERLENGQSRKRRLREFQPRTLRAIRKHSYGDLYGSNYRSEGLDELSEVFEGIPNQRMRSLTNPSLSLHSVMSPDSRCNLLLFHTLSFI